MDELQISGRRFISSRRIAKENGYHTDYIGQLIRGGKIKGQKVGRTWYVDAATFDEYLGGEPSQEPVSKKSSGLLSESQPDSAGQTFSQQAPAAVESFIAPAPEVLAPTTKVSVPVEAPADVPVEAPVEVKIEIKKEEPVVSIPVRKIETKPLKTIVVSRGITTPTGLRYIEDNEPLLPEIAPEQNVTKVMPRKEELEPAVAPEVSVQPARSAKGLLAGLAIAGVMVFVASAVVSSALLQTIKVEAGSPASVSYSIHW